MTTAVKVEGLAEFTRALKRIDTELPKALRIALNDAAEGIVTDAKRRVPRRDGPARASIKARSTRTAARIVGGGNRAPYYPWLDFGGSVGPRGSVKRPFLGQHGRYLYVALDRATRSGDLQDALETALSDTVRKAGLEAD